MSMDCISLILLLFVISILTYLTKLYIFYYQTVSYVYPANIQDTSEAIILWVYFGSVIGALVVFGVILWKVNMCIRVIFIKYLQRYSKLEILLINIPTIMSLFLTCR